MLNTTLCIITFTTFVTLITLFMHSTRILPIHNTSQTQQLSNQSSKYVACVIYKLFPQEILPPLHKRLQLSYQSYKHVACVACVASETMNSPKNISTTFNSLLSIPSPHKKTQLGRECNVRVTFLAFFSQKSKKMASSHFNLPLSPPEEATLPYRACRLV
jgi:hypothetical protein